MKPIFAIFGLFLALSPAAQRPDTTGSHALFERFMKQINTKHTQWVKTTAETVNRQLQEEKEVRAHAAQYASLGSLNTQDIEALAFLVLMQAAKSAQEDLKAIMAQVKSINNQKKQMRDALAALQKEKARMTRARLDSFKKLYAIVPQVQKKVPNAPPKNRKTALIDSVAEKWSQVHTRQISKAELDNTTEKLMNDIDSMNQMEEMESLRMQMAMDRMNKMMSTISNLLKKISDTANTITQNLK